MENLCLIALFVLISIFVTIACHLINKNCLIKANMAIFRDFAQLQALRGKRFACHNVVMVII